MNVFSGRLETSTKTGLSDEPSNLISNPAKDAESCYGNVNNSELTLTSSEFLTRFMRRGNKDLEWSWPLHSASRMRVMVLSNVRTHTHTQILAGCNKCPPSGCFRVIERRRDQITHKRERKKTISDLRRQVLMTLSRFWFPEFHLSFLEFQYKFNS